MKFCIINPSSQTVSIIDAAELYDAKIAAGLDPDKTDMGTLFTGLGYVVDEHGMFKHPQYYWAIGRVLIAGNTVLYAYSTDGETVDYAPPKRWFGRWIGNEGAAETAIHRGEIDRPQMCLPGEAPFWQWPAPMPDLQAWSDHVNKRTEGHDVMIDDTLILTLPGEKQ